MPKRTNPITTFTRTVEEARTLAAQFPKDSPPKESDKMKPITDRLLDQLSDELKSYAIDLRSKAKAACEEDDARLDGTLAEMIDEFAIDRGLLTRFAFLLRSHSTKASALAELTGGL
jgi:hypothetical protein